MLEQAEIKKVKLKQQPKAVPLHLAAILALKQSKADSTEQEPVEKALTDASGKARAVEQPTTGLSVDLGMHPIFRPKNVLEPDSSRSLVKVEWTQKGNLVLKFDDGEELVSKPVPVKHESSSTVVVGSGSADSSSFLQKTFETVSKNLDSSNCQYQYTDGVLTSLVYTNGITKTLKYTDDVLTSIVLSGNTPLGITLTKTLTYQDGNLSATTYS